MNLIKNFPELPWNWKSLCYVKNLTYEFVEDILINCGIGKV